MLLVLVGLWIPAAVNLSGVKNMGSVQVVTTILKFVALAFMSIVGPVLHQDRQLHPVERQRRERDQRDRRRDGDRLFSYLGVETAAVAAAKVRDPDRNVPRATILGTLATAVVYMLSLIAVFGIVPTAQPGQGDTRRSPTRSTRSSAAPGPAT